MYARVLILCVISLMMVSFGELKAQTSGDTITCVEGQYFIGSKEYQRYEISDTLRKNHTSAELVSKYSTKKTFGITAVGLGILSTIALLGDIEKQFIHNNKNEPNTVMIIEFCLAIGLNIEGWHLLSSASDDYQEAIDVYNSNIPRAKNSAYELNLGVRNDRLALMLNF